MPRLQRILGTAFLGTVAHLDLRGSDSIPRELLSAFTSRFLSPVTVAILGLPTRRGSGFMGV
jgi:hypothetical protein